MSDSLVELARISTPGVRAQIDRQRCGWCGATPDVVVEERVDFVSGRIVVRAACHGERDAAYVDTDALVATAGREAALVDAYVRLLRRAVSYLFPFDRYAAAHLARAWAEIGAFLPLASVLAGAHP